MGGGALQFILVFFILNFCPNIPFKGGLNRVHAKPHAGGYYALLAYQGRGECPPFSCLKLTSTKPPFNYKERAWLVVWELGLIFELPVGVVMLYPSALFFHFNIDISGKEPQPPPPFLTTVT